MGTKPDAEYEWVHESTDLFLKETQGGTSKRRPKLQFVEESGRRRRTGSATQSLIRSHARLYHTGRGKKRIEAVHEADMAASSRHAGSLALRKDHQQVNPTTFDASIAGRADPFDTLPIGKLDHVHTLINHYDKVYTKTRIAVNPKSEWLGYAISDPALLHATLLHSALHMSTLGSSSQTEVITYHNVMAIQAINQRLSDKTSKPTDTLIAAVTCLSINEILNGTPESGRTHLNGLEVMVTMRGGLKALSMSGICRRLICWVDLLHSMVWECLPRFEAIVRLEPLETTLEVEFKTAQFKTSLELVLLSAETKSHIDAITRLIADLYMIEVITNSDEYSNATMHNPMYSDRVEDVERCTVRLLQIDKVPFRDDDTIHGMRQIACIKTVAYAAIVHIYRVLHDLPTGLRIFGVVARRLKDVLETAELKSELHVLYLWALLMGEAAAASPQDKTWYRGRLEDVCLERGMYTRQSMRAALQAFLWSESYADFTWLPSTAEQSIVTELSGS